MILLMTPPEKVKLILQLLKIEYPSNIFRIEFKNKDTMYHSYDLYVFDEYKMSFSLTNMDSSTREDCTEKYKHWIRNKGMLRQLVII